MIALGPESFDFPIHCQQVFFSYDLARPGWKVVCRTNVHGRRGELNYQSNDIDLLAVGLDDEFAGLQPIATTTELA